jgi:alkaline phosphatase D
VPRVSRRSFFQAALTIGAAAAWGRSAGGPSRVKWQERADLYPEGVASADPDHNSVLLWTRRPFDRSDHAEKLILQVSEDFSFQNVVATASASVSQASDWTCRVLVGGLKPKRMYWYRFTDRQGFGSRIGRTITAPMPDDDRPARFAFVSCQNANHGAQNAFRKMIFEDERAPEDNRIGFVLHLGDFIYEIVWYPEDRPQGMYDRKLRDFVRYENGEKIQDFHIPTTLSDYRAVYRAYLRDPDIQSARARWPFVNMWDNHEFSWLGWQGLQVFDGKTHPAQTRKVAANQAFFEYQPARMSSPRKPRADIFVAPKVADVPITTFDAHGLGQEPNNLAAIHSLRGYRRLRWGRHIDLIVTDQHSYRSEDPTLRPEAKALSDKNFLDLIPEEALEILDAGRDYNDGRPPDSIAYGERAVPNFRKDEPAQTTLGFEQKKWFLEQLRTSTATWKIWGNTAGTLDMRTDPQNLPPEFPRWPGKAYGVFGGGDPSTSFAERNDIYDFVRRHKITGFATVAGDRHSFWAGLAAKGLPPKPFDPVGVAFITGSLSAPGLVEAREHTLSKDHPFRPLYVGQGPADKSPQPMVNLLLRHGVRSCLEYLKTGDLTSARSLSNPDLAPHLSFVDMGGHGYAIVHAGGDMLETEFVCVPRPLERSDSPDGGPLLYRIRSRVAMWQDGERPKLKTEIIEGNPRFSL